MRSLYLTIALLSAFSSQAQVISDIVFTDAGYAEQVWYSLANGEVHSAPKDNWDLAFEITGFTASIRYNQQKGMSVYSAPYAIGEWSDVDTTGMVANWELLIDDPKSWEKGAFNKYSTDEADLGWGIYNFITHIVSGDSIYVVKLANGTHKKLRLDALATGTYTFTHANLDGSNETTATLAKSNFTGKNFGYYDFATNSTIDREPSSDSWDLTFTKYIDLAGPNLDLPYGVTGVLQNYNRLTAQMNDTPIDVADYVSANYSTDINIIGFDWKVFDFALGYIIADDLSYFVQNPSGVVYQIVFTGFGGSATGAYEFTIEEVGVILSTGNAGLPEFGIYPNPSNGQTVRINLPESDVQAVQIYNIAGKEVANLNFGFGANTVELPTQELPAGAYLVRLIGSRNYATKKLIITQ